LYNYYFFEKILCVEGVVSYRDDHLWQLSPNTFVATLHVQINPNAYEQLISSQVLIFYFCCKKKFLLFPAKKFFFYIFILNLLDSWYIKRVKINKSNCSDRKRIFLSALVRTRRKHGSNRHVKNCAKIERE
jgi:hypothetical protein